MKTARQLITGVIPPLEPSESGINALGMMDDLRVSQLPIVKDEEFKGLISDTDILTLNNFDETIGNYPLSLSNAYVRENHHIYDVLRLFDSLKLDLLPVLDDKGHYIGSITLAGLIHHISGLMALDNPGGIIILEINEKDYLLTEIAQIVESNDARILSMYITTYPDSTRLDVTLKVNKIDVGAILQTFVRYNYIIKASFSEDTYTESLKERFDSLMNYLNI
ncbi:MAG: CBS domain-containing protein [Bacteroidetes bacterium]|nr:CBS domain-containing protein [Bacteroidota bacterium]